MYCSQMIEISLVERSNTENLEQCDLVFSIGIDLMLDHSKNIYLHLATILSLTVFLRLTQPPPSYLVYLYNKLFSYLSFVPLNLLAKVMIPWTIVWKFWFHTLCNVPSLFLLILLLAMTDKRFNVSAVIAFCLLFGVCYVLCGGRSSWLFDECQSTNKLAFLITK